MAKLNKEQLKKLYDYGGTLSPKDWADMIDNLPENPIYNKNLFPIVKTTYEEVRELYNSGKMNPNVKYQFDYKYYDPFDKQRAYFKDLIIYLDGNNVKAEYTYTKYTVEDNISSYDHSFTADFIFDSIIATSDCYEGVRPTYILNTDLMPDGSVYGNIDLKNVTEFLEKNSIPYSIVDKNDDEGIKIVFYNVAVFHEESSYKLFYNNRIIDYNTSNSDISIKDNEITPLAAIVNVKYDNGIFHKIFIDKSMMSSTDDGERENNLLILYYINFYNGDLDMVVPYSSNLEYAHEYCQSGISFTHLQTLLDYIAYNEISMSELYIEMHQSIYPIKDPNYGD